MRTLTNGTLTVECFDAEVYKQERNLVHVTDTGDNSTEVYISLGGENVIATYTLDENGQVTIDLSDYIRAYGSQAHLYVCDEDTEDSVDIGYTVKGLISPVRMLIPTPPYAMDDDTRIVAPLMMYRTLRLTSYKFEFFGGFEGTGSGCILSYHGNSYYVEIYDGSVDLSGITTYGNTIDVEMNHQLVKSILIREIPCGVKPVLVEWISATGNVKRATWLIKKPTSSIGDDVELIPTAGDYKRIKGREESITLYLDNLSQYDYWYYSDIVTSSDVRILTEEDLADGVYQIGKKLYNICFEDNTFFGIGRVRERYAVDVDTKKVSIPDGDAGDFNTLEISVNWHKYDPVAL